MCHALRQYLRAHLVLHVADLRKKLTAPQGPGPGLGGSGLGPPIQAQAHLRQVQPAYKAVDVSGPIVEALVSALDSDRRLAEAFARSRWPALERLVDLGGARVLLEVVAHAPQER